MNQVVVFGYFVVTARISKFTKIFSSMKKIPLLLKIRKGKEGEGGSHLDFLLHSDVDSSLFSLSPLLIWSLCTHYRLAIANQGNSAPIISA